MYACMPLFGYVCGKDMKIEKKNRLAIYYLLSDLECFPHFKFNILASALSYKRLDVNSPSQMHPGHTTWTWQKSVSHGQSLPIIHWRH